MVSILIIGDEILSGSVREANLYPLISGLASVGYPVQEVRIVSDGVEHIATAIRDLLKSAAYVVTVGGIGPTHDDRTLEAVAVACDVPLVRNAEMLRFLEGRYGTPLTPMVEKMADLPVGTEVQGCAQGRWPLIRREQLFVLPGLPVALLDKLQRLLGELPPRRTVAQRKIYLTADESEFADWLTAYQDRNGTVTIGSYPVHGQRDYAAHIDVRGDDRDEVLRCAGELQAYAVQHNWFVRTEGDLEGE